MRVFTLLLVCTILKGYCYAQTAPNKFWIQFTDKDNTPYSITSPEAYLSQRAIDRRERYNIPLEENDLPVDPQYIEQTLAAGNIYLLHRSKWFNAITVWSEDSLALDTLDQLPFVAQVRSVQGGKGAKRVDKFGRYQKCELSGYHSTKYGESFPQIAMHNGHVLHDRGNDGQGMLIGVLDSGFEQVDSLEAFQHLFAKGQIKATYDFVAKETDVYDDHSHGMYVLSCMAGILERHLIGTAPGADYILLRTEDAGSEYIIEEDNWVAGAEFADSAGCDILNTSLGYTVFNDSTQDHSYADLDGATTRISIAAGIAAQKGMIPVNSAGNEGDDTWYHISAPADGIGVLSVGAVNAEREPASFSGHGPSADGRVKPDVAAVGWGAVGSNFNNSPIYINGTSFSSPLMAGLVACVWQDNLDHPNHEVIQAIQLSAHKYENPDDKLGYGIPDMYVAWNLLKGRNLLDHFGPELHNVFPNPFNGHFYIEFYNDEAQELHFELFDVMGRKVWGQRVWVPENRLCVSRVDDAVIDKLAPGQYIMQVKGVGVEHIFRVQKAE